MRAGKLDKIVLIESRGADTVDAYGTPTEGTWTERATVRGEQVQASTQEYFRGYGETEQISVIFRTRFVEGVDLTDRITVESHIYNLREIKQLGRRQGLELRCEIVR